MIPHFIMCFGWWSNISFHVEDLSKKIYNRRNIHVWTTVWFRSYAEKTLKENFLSKMRRYGIRSAILTILKFWREDLQSKEAVNQYYHRARKAGLMPKWQPPKRSKGRWFR